MAERARRRISKPLKVDVRGCPISVHGTRGSYNRGCRCEDCHKAATEYRRQYRWDHYVKTPDRRQPSVGGRCPVCNKKLPPSRSYAERAASWRAHIAKKGCRPGRQAHPELVVHALEIAEAMIGAGAVDPPVPGRHRPL